VLALAGPAQGRRKSISTTMITQWFQTSAKSRRLMRMQCTLCTWHVMHAGWACRAVENSKKCSVYTQRQSATWFTWHHVRSRHA
jgi:hypothetical protein